MLSRIFSNQIVSCSSIQKRFSEYVDGMLSASERLLVHEHLKCCEVCTDELDLFCKTLGLLSEVKEECLPSGIQNYRLPRSTFVEIFPSIRREQRPPLTFVLLVPYVCASILVFMVLSTWNLVEKHDFHQRYNASNYVEVVAKI